MELRSHLGAVTHRFHYSAARDAETICDLVLHWPFHHALGMRLLSLSPCS